MLFFFSDGAQVAVYRLRDRTVSFHHSAGLTVRARTRAAIGIVSELVDMYSSLRRRIIAGDVVSDSCRGGLGCLIKGDSAPDLGITPENCDCGRRDNESVSRKDDMDGRNVYRHNIKR